jgi:hypothetical protein
MIDELRIFQGHPLSSSGWINSELIHQIGQFSGLKCSSFLQIEVGENLHTFGCLKRQNMMLHWLVGLMFTMCCFLQWVWYLQKPDWLNLQIDSGVAIFSFYF